MVKLMAIDYYMKLFHETKVSQDSDFFSLQNFVLKKISDAHASLLVSPITPEIIRSTMFSLKSFSAPSLDGFNASFFKSNWEIIGSDVINSILYSFDNYFMYFPFNATAISLIPKVDDALSMKDFRPISCCNVLYKCISKVLADRLKLILPHIIDPCQNAFVKWRVIFDNILTMHDIISGYHLNLSPSRATLKIDIMKAFDTVNWTFLFQLMALMNFPPVFISWVEMCITTASFSLNLNGLLLDFLIVLGISGKGILSPPTCSLSQWNDLI